ncbi:inositol monophosphatase family protein, partial [Dietzia sp. SLG310A2-38A2]|uniref:inositol monophosphatase family protein n=1 Tax=Dietzia sp. SLG310A2-38A2 TaxID=1630643 RepID=UPI002407AEEE
MSPDTRHRRPPADEAIPPMSDADLAARLVVDAGTLARRLREDGLDVHHKTSVSDVVTEADRAAEHQITALLASHRPEDGVLGEEGTLVP